MDNNFGAMGQTSAPPMQRMSPGGFWRRFAALFIDSLIIGIVCWPAKLLIMAVQQVSIASGDSTAAIGATMGATILSIALNYGVAFFYYGYFLSAKGASPGKMVLGLKVVDNDNGTNLSFMMGGLRCTIGYLVGYMTLLIGFIMVGFRQDKKALHDMIFNSHVWHKE